MGIGETVDDSSEGDGDNEVGGGAAVFVRALSVGAVFCAEDRLVIEGDEVGGIGVGFEDDAAAVAAVAAVGSAAGDEFFTAEAAAAVAAVAGFGVDADLVNKLHGGGGRG